MLTHFYCKIIFWLFWTIFQTTKCFNLFSSFLHTACSYNCLEPIKLISTIFGCLLHLCWCIYTSCCKVFGWSRTLYCHQALRHIYHWKKDFYWFILSGIQTLIWPFSEHFSKNIFYWWDCVGENWEEIVWGRNLTLWTKIMTLTSCSRYSLNNWT